MNIKDIVKGFILWVKGSADNEPGGASSKKLTAFWCTVIIATPTVYIWLIWAAKKGDWTYLPHVLDATYIFILGCLGVNAYEKVKGKLGGKNEEVKQ